jgi:hypothetical protein
MRLERGCCYPEKFSFIAGKARSRSYHPQSSWDVSLAVRAKAYTFTTERFTESGALI